MRILFVSPVYTGAGGIEHLLWQWSHGLASRGHEVVVAVNGTPRGDVPVEFEVLHFPNREVAGRYRVSPSMGKYLTRTMKKFDIVHAHQPRAFGTQLVALARSPSTVLTSHLHQLSGGRARRSRHARHLRLLSRCFDELVFVSEAERALYARVIGRDLADSPVVRPGFDESVLLAPLMPARRPLVLAIGRLVEHKRMDVVIQVAAELRDVADVVIVGDGPDRAALAELASSLGLDPGRLLVGHQPSNDLASWTRSADVFMSLSTEEAFGISVLDAAAAGARLLVSDLPSHREILSLVGTLPSALVDTSKPSEIASQVRALLAMDVPSHEVSLPTWADAVTELELLYDSLAGS